MFRTQSIIQSPRGFMFFEIDMSCKKLNNEDKIISFSLIEHVHQWFSSPQCEDYMATPDSMVLGLWLSLTERIKSDRSNIERDVVINRVTIKAEGSNISFGLDTYK